ncbi:MAG: PaaI family thioesterase [Aureispira sp.]
MSESPAYQLVKKNLYDQDAFSQWLGIELHEIEAGKAILSLTVRAEMTNGFGLAHGGITYSLADSALAFAANAHGRHSLSIETSIAHTSAAHTGDVLTATATEEHLSYKIGLYRIVIHNQKQELVALFKGTVYRSSKEWALES